MKQKILIVRNKRVGDAILTSTLCTNLRHSFPDAEIHYLVDQYLYDIFKDHPHIDKVISFTDKENYNFLRYLKRVYRLMKSERYDIIIDTRATIKSFFFSLFSLSSKFRIGRWKWYTPGWLHNYKIKQEFKNMDIIDGANQLLKPLERLGKIHYGKEFCINITKEESADFHSYMAERGVDFSKPVIVCVPFTRVVDKAWDMERMKGILFKILEYCDAQLVINYAGAERERAVRLYEEMGRNPRLFINIEADSLRKLGAMFTCADFFFGNEGGARHFAQAMGVPGLAIYPPYVNMSKWLPNASERYRGISPKTVVPEEKWQGVPPEEQFALLTEDHVWESLSSMLDIFLKERATGVERTL